MRMTVILILILGILAVVGCQEEPLGPVPVDMQAKNLISLEDNIEHHQLLENLHYELIEGTVIPGRGGLIGDTLSTWPKGCFFGLQVPPGALDTQDPTPVAFSVQVPTYESYMMYSHLNLPLILRLEPDGIEFHDSVTVMATYMPWVKDEPVDFWNVAPVVDKGAVVDVIYQDVGKVDVQSVDAGRRVSFKVNHFSDWEVGELPD